MIHPPKNVTIRAKNFIMRVEGDRFVYTCGKHQGDDPALRPECPSCVSAHAMATGKSNTNRL